MLVCKNCEKEYDRPLKYCPLCGFELIEHVKNISVDSPGIFSDDVEAKNNILKVTNVIKNHPHEKKCKNCGSTIIGDEKFCINCGTSANAETSSTPNEKVKSSAIKHSLTLQDHLQENLTDAFHSNKFFDFFWKYAIAFALYYPTYLLMSRIKGLNGVVQVLDNISIFAFYAYYIGLVALWSKKNYFPMLIAFAIRFLNSFILLFQTKVPISSICRITVLITTFVLVFKEFRTHGQYQNIKKIFHNIPCPICGAFIKATDKFCSKCGRRMEE